MAILWRRYNCLIFSIISYILALIFIYYYINGHHDEQNMSQETSKTIFILCLLIGTLFLSLHYILTYICNYNKVRSLNYHESESDSEI